MFRKLLGRGDTVRHKMMRGWTLVIPVRMEGRGPTRHTVKVEMTGLVFNVRKASTTLMTGAQDTAGFLKGKRKREPRVRRPEGA